MLIKNRNDLVKKVINWNEIIKKLGKQNAYLI